MDSAPASGSGEPPARALDTAKKLRAFLDLLSGFCVANRGDLARRRAVFADVGGDDIPGIMQFLDLLAASYLGNPGGGRGFCRIMCDLMVGWADAEEGKRLEMGELEAAMISKWGISGRPQLIPDELLEAMRPE